MHIHMKRQLDDEQYRFLKDRLNPDIKLTMGVEPPTPAEYRFLVAGRPGRDLIEASRCLEGLIIPWAGIPTSTRELMHEFTHISVHNLHHNASATAEMALTLLFAAAKTLVPVDQALRRGDWRYRWQPDISLLLEGKTALMARSASVLARC